MELTGMKSSKVDILPTSNCGGPPKTTALQYLQSRQLTMFAESMPDIPTDDDWINQAIPEEEDKTLLLVAIEDGLYDYADVLLRAGADPSLYSRELQVTPLAMAIKKKDLAIMKLLITHRANINGIVVQTGRTPLHLAASQGFTEGVSLLLQQPSIDVAIKDKKGQQTALYMAIMAGDQTSVILLIGSGSSLDNTCAGKTIREHLALKMPGIDPDTIDKRSLPKPANALSEQLESLINNIQMSHDEAADQFESVLLNSGVDAKALEQYRASGQTLIQRACYEERTRIVKALLGAGCDANARPESSQMVPVLISASRGDVATLKILVQSKADLVSAIKAGTDESLLHCLLKKSNLSTPQARIIEALEYLLAGEDGDGGPRHQVKKIINKRDINGNTALHYAAQTWPQHVSRLLLEAGANIGMKNQWGEVAAIQILPETMETFLDEFCMTSNQVDVNHDSLEVTFNYSFLAPANDDLPKDLRQPNEEDDPEDPGTKLVSDKPQKYALPETEALWHLGQSKEHRHLLKHPVITSFLWF